MNDVFLDITTYNGNISWVNETGHNQSSGRILLDTINYEFPVWWVNWDRSIFEYQKEIYQITKKITKLSAFTKAFYEI